MSETDSSGEQQEVIEQRQPRRRRNFSRSQHHFKPRDERKQFDGARHVRRRRRLQELLVQLEALNLDADDKDEEEEEITPLERLFIEEDSMTAWQSFINLSEEQQCQLLQMPSPKQQSVAVTSEQAYNRISCKLRHLLRRKRIQTSAELEGMEAELVECFVEQPSSTYTTILSDSYKRLLFHAVVQYLDLKACSFDSRGARHTRALCKHNTFTPPLCTLACHIQTTCA